LGGGGEVGTLMTTEMSQKKQKGALERKRPGGKRGGGEGKNKQKKDGGPNRNEMWGERTGVWSCK